MQHEHLKFYQHEHGTMLGGVQVTPSLNLMTPENMGREEDEAEDIFSNADYVAVIDYLKRLPVDTKATLIDINRELRINLQMNMQVMEHLKSNPKIEYGHDNDGSLFFQFRSKYLIRNREELLQTLDRSQTGLVLSDVENCYPGAMDDIQSMIVGGEIIACKNKEKKTFILFPRGIPFYSELSGTLKATPRRQQVTTSSSLLKEIRRGEALKCGQYWYRVSCSVGGGSHGQPQRATAPPSVTLDKEMSDRNVYLDPFTADSIPLDGGFEGTEEFFGKAIKHGVANDIKDRWNATVDDLKPFFGHDELLRQELIKKKQVPAILQGDSGISKMVVSTNKTKRKRKERPLNMLSGGFGTNSHLRGTDLELLFTGNVGRK